MFLDLSDVAANSSPYDLPSGQYIMECISAEAKDTKTSGGKFLNVKLKVTGGKEAGKSVYTRFNFLNKSEKAQQIGRSELKSMMLAMGMGPILDSPADLVGKICMVKIGQETRQDGSSGPVVKGYSNLTHATTPEGGHHVHPNGGL